MAAARSSTSRVWAWWETGVPQWLVNGWGQLVIAAAKAAAMYAIALVGLRLAHRRTLSQWMAIDFAAAVALGAITAAPRSPKASRSPSAPPRCSPSLLAHYLVTVGRFHPRFARLVDQRVRVLIDHGRLRPNQLRRCGLTEDEVIAQLRNTVWPPSPSCATCSTRPRAS
jgi:uncharacterized membrane protein YcaP (DUF421 family)